MLAARWRYYTGQHEGPDGPPPGGDDHRFSDGAVHVAPKGAGCGGRISSTTFRAIGDPRQGAYGEGRETELLTGLSAALAWEKGVAEEAIAQASKLSKLQQLLGEDRGAKASAVIAVEVVNAKIEAARFKAGAAWQATAEK